MAQETSEQTGNKFAATVILFNVLIAGLLSLIPGWGDFYHAFFYVCLGAAANAIYHGWFK